MTQISHLNKKSCVHLDLKHSCLQVGCAKKKNKQTNSCLSHLFRSTCSASSVLPMLKFLSTFFPLSRRGFTPLSGTGDCGDGIRHHSGCSRVINLDMLVILEKQFVRCGPEHFSCRPCSGSQGLSGGSLGFRVLGLLALTILGFIGGFWLSFERRLCPV